MVAAQRQHGWRRALTLVRRRESSTDDRWERDIDSVREQGWTSWFWLSWSFLSRLGGVPPPGCFWKRGCKVLKTKERRPQERGKRRYATGNTRVKEYRGDRGMDVYM